MKLAGHSDAGYLKDQKARSRAGRNFYMSNSYPFLPNNGAAQTILKIIKAVMSSTVDG